MRNFVYVKREIVLLYCSKNKLLFLRWWWRLHCTRPTCLIDMLLHSDTSYWLCAAPFRHIILTMSRSIQTHHTDYEPLHSDTSYWLWAKFLLLLLKAYCRSIKYHYYNLWFDKNQGSNPRSTILKAITLSITSTRPIL
jgi:hypothetical protein